MSTDNEAQKQNPALKVLEGLIGQWATQGTHPLVPGTTFHGRATCERIESGAFLIMRTQIDEPEIPSGISIFGSDDATGEFFMLYFDERGVSRKYDVTFADNVIQWSRMTPEFSQRMRLEISEDGTTIASSGEMSRGGGAWEPDLSLTYTRLS